MILEEGQLVDQSRENKSIAPKDFPPAGHSEELLGTVDAAAWTLWGSLDSVEHCGCSGAAWLLRSSLDAAQPAGTFPLPR